MSRLLELGEKIIPILKDIQASNRYQTCLTCSSFIMKTNQCNECGCFMMAKVLIPKAECPLDKWPKP